MKTIAQQINWDFEANGNLEIKDKKGGLIYNEFSNGYWTKREYNSKGNEIYFKDSDKFWEKREYDSKGNQIYLENSTGFWEKAEYDSKNLVVYYADSEGNKEDVRPKPCKDNVVEIDNVKHKSTKL